MLEPMRIPRCTREGSSRNRGDPATAAIRQPYPDAPPAPPSGRPGAPCAGPPTEVLMHAYTRPTTLPGAARRMDLHEIARLRAAAEHARRVLPGALGELAARELRAHADLGYHGAPDALMPQLARQVLALPAPALPAPSLPAASPPP
jgi:hypothetical protein